MGRKLASLAGIVAASFAFGLFGAVGAEHVAHTAGHMGGHTAGHHVLAEDQGPTLVH